MAAFPRGKRTGHIRFLGGALFGHAPEAAK
jgi:hypothetical protein